MPGIKTQRNNKIGIRKKLGWRIYGLCLPCSWKHATQLAGTTKTRAVRSMATHD